MILKRILIILGFVVLWIAPAASGREVLKIRVAIFKDIPDLTMSVAGSFDILDAKTQQLFYRGREHFTFKIAASQEGFKFENKVFKTSGIVFAVRNKSPVTVNKRRYRGDITLVRQDNNLLLVVNTLDMESYLKGVLYHEISPKWPIEAIKAQAVAARTYAMYQREVMKAKDYDVMADTSSQVYGGFTSENHKTNRAVNFTYGEVLTFGGRVFPAYFHATCGGMTENAAELWKTDIEPLRGQKTCSFCQGSPHYFWQVSFDLKTIQKKLGAVYRGKEDLDNISVQERTVSGRVRTLMLKDASGVLFPLSAKDFRQLMGPDVIRSTNFSILLDGQKATFQGKGWGHGVGLCQWGALGMSQKGYGYKEILEFYYPGSKLVKIN